LRPPPVEEGDEKPVTIKSLLVTLVLSLVTLTFGAPLGQEGMVQVFAEGFEAGAAFLILAGIIKLCLMKIFSYSGWKGGEIFPGIFSMVLIGLGFSQLIPEIHSLICIAALESGYPSMALKRPIIAGLVVILFIPLSTYPLVITGCTVTALVLKIRKIRLLRSEAST